MPEINIGDAACYAPLERYEFGIALRDEVHRWAMTYDEAQTWYDEWVEMGAKPEAISVIRREIGDWEKYQPKHDI